jgi:hypothetical protein
MSTRQAQMRAVLTIDTEADNAWENHLNPNVTNVAGLRELAQLLRRYGAKATCLLTYRVADDAQAISVLRELAGQGLVEVGAHLHPWESPPFMDNGLDRRYHTYPHELPLSVFRSKMEMLTARIAENFESPVSYRGGRWGLSPQHVAVLEELGYQVDTSVTPLITWGPKPGLPISQGGRGGCDYSRAPLQPYYLSYYDVTRPGQAALAEMPVTVQFTQRVPMPILQAYGYVPRWARRLLEKAKVLHPVWAFAAEEKNERMRQMLKNYCFSSLSYFNMSCHSSELMLGTSPHSRTPAALARTLGNIELALQALAATGRCQFCTLVEAARAWKAENVRPAATPLPPTDRPVTRSSALASPGLCTVPVVAAPASLAAAPMTMAAAPINAPEAISAATMSHASPATSTRNPV